MSWNYRLVRYKDDPESIGLHEVFYNDAGEAWAMTERPVGFAGPNVEEVVASLELALRDAKNKPVFQEPEKWAERDFGDEMEAGKRFSTAEEMVAELNKEG
jgi:hypothetical protein